jgi:hypothetical protein
MLDFPIASAHDLIVSTDRMVPAPSRGYKGKGVLCAQYAIADEVLVAALPLGDCLVKAAGPLTSGRVDGAQHSMTAATSWGRRYPVTKRA